MTGFAYRISKTGDREISDMMDLGKRAYPPGRLVTLVGCGKEKREDGRVHMAKDLYTSNYYELKCKLTASLWYILSAKYSLLHPCTPIRFYDRDMDDVDKEGETAEWSDLVVDQLRVRWGIFNTRQTEAIVLLAGANYVDPLLDAFRRSRQFEISGNPYSLVVDHADYGNEGVRVSYGGHTVYLETPLRGMPLFTQMSWLKHRTTENRTLSESGDSSRPSESVSQ